jgi:hypothetical protein
MNSYAQKEGKSTIKIQLFLAASIWILGYGTSVQVRAEQQNLVDCHEKFGSKHAVIINVMSDIKSWMMFAERGSSTHYAREYLKQLNFVTIADLASESIMESLEFLALCDDKGRLQSLATYSSYDQIVVRQGGQSVALGKGIYVQQLISVPLGYRGRVRAAGLEALARLYQRVDISQPVIKLEYTEYAKGFYERFGFKQADGISMFAFKHDFISAYDFYLSRCAL